MKEMGRMRFGVVAAWVALASMILVMPVRAADRTWIDTTTTGLWSTASNWSGGAVPGPSDNAYWRNADGVNSSIMLDTDQTIGNLIYPNQNSYYSLSNDTTRLTISTNLMFNCRRSVAVFRNVFMEFRPRANILGKVIADPQVNASTIGLLFCNTNNVFAGGFDITGNRIAITNTLNTFNATMKVRGWMGEWWTTDERSAGTIQIHSGNNTFGVGEFILNPAGKIWISMPNDLSAITNITFNGGTLQLGRPGQAYSNTFTAANFPNGFEVKAGTLHVSGNASLGSPAIGVKLGSAGYYGCLKGEAQNLASAWIDRPIQLAGNGGVLDSYYPNVSYPSTINRAYEFYIPGVISGSGDLIMRGHNNSVTYVHNGAYAGYTPNTYAGDTRITAASQVIVESYRSLGTSNLVVESGSILQNNTTNIVRTGKAITIKRGGTGVLRPMGIVNVNTTGDWAMPITTNSDGVLLLSVSTAGMTAFNNWIGSSQLGNGTMWLGGSGTLTVTNLPPGVGGVYRLWGCPWSGAWLAAVGGWFVLDAAGTANGVLTGTNTVEIGLPYNPYNPWGGQLLNGQVFTYDTNTYSGATLVNVYATLAGLAGPAGGGSPFGSTNGEVYLKGGQLCLWGNDPTRVQPVRKGRLTVQGGAVLREYSLAGGVADLTFDDLVRSNRGTITTYMESGVLGSISNRIKFVNHKPVPVGGMIPPWIVATDGFLTYDATAGLTNAVITHTVPGAFPTGLSAGTEIVNVTGNTTLGDNPYINALSASANVGPSAGTAITLASGGLFLKLVNPVISAGVVFGTVSGSTTSLVEACIFRSDNGANQAEISGKITSAGLTKSGRGAIKLSNPGNDIRGPIVIDNGRLYATSWACVGTNDIIMNGGGFYSSAGANYTNTFRIGPGGGATESVSFYGPVVDLVPGDAGPMRPYSGNFYGTNTWTGGIYLDGQECRFMNPWSLPTNCPIICRNGNVYIQATGICTNLARISLMGDRARLEMRCYLYLGSIEGSGYVTAGNVYDGGSGAALDVGWDNTDFDFYGSLIELAGYYLHWAKSGTGTMTFWGDSTHHGYTRIKDGTLTVNGAIFNSTNITVYAGATLNGKGAIWGPVTVNPGATLGGSLVLASNLTVSAGSAFSVNLSSATDGGISVRGAAITGSTLTLTLGFKPAVGQTFTILNNTSAGAIVGEFTSGRLINTSFNGVAYTFAINYAGGDGNDIVLTLLPRGTLMSVR
jgi:autotransporter-associated beta strand protein